MVDPWEKAYVYGHYVSFGKVAHIVIGRYPVCDAYVDKLNHTPNPFPVCKSCLRTKRAKELGL